MVYILLLIIVILLVVYFRLYHHYRRNVEKVTFMFDALENVDYTFHFPEDVRSRDDAMLNAALNRIKTIMEKYPEYGFVKNTSYPRALKAMQQKQ